MSFFLWGVIWLPFPFPVQGVALRPAWVWVFFGGYLFGFLFPVLRERDLRGRGFLGVVRLAFSSAPESYTMT